VGFLAPHFLDLGVHNQTIDIALARKHHAYKSRFEAFVDKEVEQNQKNRIIESQNPSSDFRKKRNRSTIDRLNSDFK
jgi:hypothetical protein